MYRPMHLFDPSSPKQVSGNLSSRIGVAVQQHGASKRGASSIDSTNLWGVCARLCRCRNGRVTGFVQVVLAFGQGALFC